VQPEPHCGLLSNLLLVLLCVCNSLCVLQTAVQEAVLQCSMCACKRN
jgi:hypothetical protein